MEGVVVSVLALVAVAAATCTEPVQLVNSSGNFSAADGLDDALLHAAGDAAFKVVAVVGPQSSGKSTILNSCFGTTFGVMDEANGRDALLALLRVGLLDALTERLWEG